jgi:regulator of sirC expression with transglutaminase-like and TPR domain
VSDSLVAAFAALAGGEGDEISAALLVNQWLEPTLQPASVRAQLDRLTDGAATDQPPWALLAALGFGGNTDDYDNALNSRLDWVVAHRRGIPITLAVLLLQVARNLGHRAVGINFPGHFLARVDDTLIDPFDMCESSEQTWTARLDPALPRAGLFAPASPTMIAQRMLNNLKLQAYRDRALPQALELLDLQLAMAPQDPALLFEQGECWLGLGAQAAASAAFSRALAAGAPPQLRQLIRKRLDRLDPGAETLH